MIVLNLIKIKNVNVFINYNRYTYHLIDERREYYKYYLRWSASTLLDKCYAEIFKFQELDDILYDLVETIVTSNDNT